VGSLDTEKGSEGFVKLSPRARESNRLIAEAALRRRLFSPVPFFCECGEEMCSELVPMRVAEYAAQRRGSIVAPGHADPSLEFSEPESG
jgi:hypothetical protein